MKKQVFCGVFALALAVTGCGVQKKEAASDIVPENRQELTILHVDAGTEGFDSFSEWMDHFHPMQFGERLWICPSWRDVPDENAVNVMLDPGLAFGTGTHPTTAMCLQWLDGLDLAGKTIIDFGCGSGILAIAALKLGAAKAIGIDIDP